MENYEVVKFLGKGSHGDVFLVRHLVDKQLYAMKKIPLKDTSVEHRQGIFQEVNLVIL
jgi:NIMA (never in mitosis gene a)-related kinase